MTGINSISCLEDSDFRPDKHIRRFSSVHQIVKKMGLDGVKVDSAALLVSASDKSGLKVNLICLCSGIFSTVLKSVSKILNMRM
jgi:hypothetical protein